MLDSEQDHTLTGRGSQTDPAKKILYGLENGVPENHAQKRQKSGRYKLLQAVIKSLRNEIRALKNSAFQRTVQSWDGNPHRRQKATLAPSADLHTDVFLQGQACCYRSLQTEPDTLTHIREATYKRNTGRAKPNRAKTERADHNAG